jgi:hypothetical protein
MTLTLLYKYVKIVSWIILILLSCSSACLEVVGTVPWYWLVATSSRCKKLSLLSGFVLLVVDTMAWFISGQKNTPIGGPIGVCRGLFFVVGYYPLLNKVR